MLKTNENKLAMTFVQGQPDHPAAYMEGNLDNDGRNVNGVSMGGITYNKEIGDNCMDIVGDHIEPGVTSRNKNTAAESFAYMSYACIGNTVRVMGGKADGDTGYVTGKHGGGHTMIYFPKDTLKKLTYQDQLMIDAYGMGLALTDYPDVTLYNMDPALVHKMGIREENGKLVIPVTHVIPAVLIGSGKAQSNPHGTGNVMMPQRSDADIVTTDRPSYEKYRLGELRFGDIVFIEDWDSTYGRTYRKGSVTVGVIIHSDSGLMGHGPGVTTLMTCRDGGTLVPEIDRYANLAYHLGIKKRD